MALFIRQGMAAWIHAWPKTQAPAANISRHQVFETTGNLPELPSSLRAQITMLLADMIVNRSYQEAML